MIQAYGHPKFYTIRIFRRGERKQGREGVCVHRRLQLHGIRFSWLGPMDSRDVFACIDSDFMCTFHL
ncbi:hypothetical protein CMV_030428 [Castanea mollissima]|uniref:Uncharacterized protein n=1 Tax=Castanea mollissima TaxID=60419 RepID=A0A8J4V9V1_9ROSI|nr:hypothetical protein CMV_030428 [Castanea mollissima]